MPTYDYLCSNCGKFESFQSITAPPHEICPNCGCSQVKRLISANSNIIFKGGGFYCTDNRKAGSPEKPAGSSTAAK